MLEFTYTNRGTKYTTAIHTNKIRVYQSEDGSIHYDRRYVGKDGRINDAPIDHTFSQHDGAVSMANAIHWGCCGWLKYHSKDCKMVKDIQEFLDSLLEVSI